MAKAELLRARRWVSGAQQGANPIRKHPSFFKGFAPSCIKGPWPLYRYRLAGRRAYGTVRVRPDHPDHRAAVEGLLGPLEQFDSLDCPSHGTTTETAVRRSPADGAVRTARRRVATSRSAISTLELPSTNDPTPTKRRSRRTTTVADR